MRIDLEQRSLKGLGGSKLEQYLEIVLSSSNNLAKIQEKGELIRTTTVVSDGYGHNRTRNKVTVTVFYGEISSSSGVSRLLNLNNTMQGAGKRARWAWKSRVSPGTYLLWPSSRTEGNIQAHVSLGLIILYHQDRWIRDFGFVILIKKVFCQRSDSTIQRWVRFFDQTSNCALFLIFVNNLLDCLIRT